MQPAFCRKERTQRSAFLCRVLRRIPAKAHSYLPAANSYAWDLTIDLELRVLSISTDRVRLTKTKRPPMTEHLIRPKREASEVLPSFCHSPRTRNLNRPATKASAIAATAA